jgi:pseudaminic acid biosynthesis-associated methylase
MDRNEQEEFWQGDFGDEYTLRNAGDWDEFYEKQWGITRTALNNEFLSKLDRNALILEIGCNRANQLQILHNQGFTNLWGIDVNQKALGIAKENKSFNIVEGSALDIPFKDGFFDLAFTSGVLIHIFPDDVEKVMQEMYRVAKRFIWCFEYFSEERTEIEYRGYKNRLWKNNFLRLFTELYPDLTVVKQRKVKYLQNENVDMMFLLEKQ